jgi:hypothetical protein
LDEDPSWITVREARATVGGRDERGSSTSSAGDVAFAPPMLPLPPHWRRGAKTAELLKAVMRLRRPHTYKGYKSIKPSAGGACVRSDRPGSLLNLQHNSSLVTPQVSCRYRNHGKESNERYDNRLSNPRPH